MHRAIQNFLIKSFYCNISITNPFIFRVHEAITLLNLAKGSALLLRDTLLALEGASGIEDTRSKTLKEIGVNKFTPKMAVKILNQRMDITPNRLAVD